MLRKKLVTLTLFLFTLFFFISCAKKTDDSSTTTKTSFAPPSWIHGAWVDNVSSSTKNGYKFDSSDVYLVIFGQVTAGFVAAGVSMTQLTSTDSEFSYSYPLTATSGGETSSGTATYVFAKVTTSIIGLTGSSTLSGVSVSPGNYTKDTSL